jgi:DNA helicase HerA-like ATPase
MTDERSLTDDSVFKVGRVIGVQGRTVRISVDKAKNGSHLLYRGEVLRNVGVGGYLKITKGFSEIIAKVDGETVEEAGGNLAYRSQQDRVERLLTVSLIGYFSNEIFQRGVRELPLVDNECFLLTKLEFDRIHSFVSGADVPLTIGKLAMAKGQPVSVGVNALFASHIGIFGNTGSGKSYTLAKLYHELLTTYRNSANFRKRARLVLIDFNGEYVNDKDAEPTAPSGSVIIEGKLKTEYVLSTRNDDGDRLPVSQTTMEDPIFWTVLLDATEKTQAPFLQRALQSGYWEQRLTNATDLKAAMAAVVYAAIKSNDHTLEKGLIVKFLEEIEGCLGENCPDELRGYIEDIRTSLGYHSVSRSYYYRDAGSSYVYANDPAKDAFFREITYGRFSMMPIAPDGLQDVDRIRFKIVLQYYSDIFNGFANREHLGPLIKRLETRIPRIKRLIEVSDDPLLASALTVISLRHVSLEMKKVLPLLICRQLYDDKKGKPGSSDYLNIIIDEAHNILSTSSARESEAWKDYRLETFEEIIKEGRKFGVFLTIASQRPHDISETIISQLHNYFLHRLVNNLDILAIEKAVSYLDRVSFESLPILPIGTCVLSGISAQIPLIVTIDTIPERYEPNNRTMTLVDKWTIVDPLADHDAEPEGDSEEDGIEIIDDQWAHGDEPPF